MTDQPAFPRTIQRWNDSFEHVEGMSLRDYFAGQAMAAMVGGYWSRPDAAYVSDAVFAAYAYDQADAMLAARGEAR